AELETAVRLGLPLVCIVYNDAAYGAEGHHFCTQEMNPPLETVTFRRRGIASIASGSGAEEVTDADPWDVDAVVGWIGRKANTPLVIDARIASDGGAWWLQEAFSNH